MATELTKRQRDALIAIHTLTVRNGAAPTIREMRNALDVSSDQTVIEMLERLEKGGLIARDKKQARATSLTDKARMALGITPTSSLDAPQTPMELDEQEQKVHDWLAEIDVRLGRMYKGSLSAFRNNANEDRIAQAAHSMREIIDHLSNKGNADAAKPLEERNKQDRTGRTVRGLRTFFDPQAGAAAEQNPYKRLYDEYQSKLQSIAHHHEYASETEYLDLAKGLERFLLRYVFPSQNEVYKLLEATLKKDPNDVDAGDLLLLVKKNVESERFFYKHADARWLQYLRDNKFLDATWEVGDYLSRVASDSPDLVLDIFLETTMPNEAWGAKTTFAVAASKLSPSHASKTVKKILDEEWVKDVRATLLHYRLQDLLKTLLVGKEYETALVFADALLDIFPREYGSYGSRDTRAYISEYEYDQVVKYFADVSAEELLPFLKMFAKKMIKMIAEVHIRGEDGDDDYSYIWRPAIEDHAQNHMHDNVDDCIISAVRDLLERRVRHLVTESKPEEARRELEEVLAHTVTYPILKRFRLHIYRLFPEVFDQELQHEISTPELSSKAWHEYSLLTSAHFDRLSTKAKKKYFDVIDAEDKKDDKYIDSWRVRLIGLVAQHLDATKKKKYARLLKQSAKLDQPHFTSYHSEASVVGFDSPKKESDLENKPTSEVLEVLKTWAPTGDEFFGPSRSGLGMALRNVVAKEGSKYSAVAPDFFAPDVRPVYLYHLLSGFMESLKTDTKLDWNAILELSLRIVAESKRDALPPVEGDEKRNRMEADWKDVMQELCRLITRGLDTNTIPFSKKKEVWTVIEHLTEHPHPTPEHEEKYGRDNSDPYTMSINTVRGDAFHAVFAYIFWHNRAEKSTSKSWKAYIPDEVKKVLELHLDPAHDPSLTIRSVYGRFFPWMLSYGGDWAKNLKDKVFPVENPALRYAALETYLTNMVFAEAYELLRPLYELAVNDIRGGKVPKRKYWADVPEHLATHAMVAYAFEIEDGANPFYKYFFKTASGKTCGMAVSIGGRHFISRDNTPAGEKVPKMEVLKRFWDWRLEESNAPSELREFGWWAKADKFDHQWLLERLLKTVEKTKGDINGEFIVMGTVNYLSEKYPLLCAKILKSVFTSSGKRDRFVFLHVREFGEAATKIFKSGDEEAKKIVRSTIDFLLKIGFEELRTLEDQAK
jgi:hypothetical protein